MKTLLPVLLTLCNTLMALSAYSQQVYFNKEYDFNNSEDARSVLETDSGYLVIMDTKAQNQPISNIFLFLDKKGNKIRTKKLSVPLTNLYHGSRGSGIKVTGNNPGYLYAGVYQDTVSGKGYLVKLNSLGDTLWTKIFSNGIVSVFDQCKQTADGGFVMCGVTGPPSDTMGTADFWLVKTDSIGNKEWEKRYQDTSFSRAYTIGLCKDKGYVLGGTVRGPNKPATVTYDSKVIKVDSVGKVQWTTRWGGGYSDHIFNIEETNDGGYITCGFYGDVEYLTELRLTKLDQDGDIEWDNSYGPIKTTSFRMVHEVEDGSFIVAGSSSDGLSGSYTGVAVKVAADGKQIWYRQHRFVEVFASNSLLEDIKPTSDGGFIACGSVYGDAQGAEGQNIWVLKLDSLGCAAPGGCPNLYTGIEEIPVASGEEIVIYPNPAHNELNIKFESIEYLGGILEIYSLTGSRLTEARLNEYIMQVDVSHLPVGTYFYHVKSSVGHSKKGKLLISR